MIKSWFALYNPWRSATLLVYMLQNTEYRVGPYIKWFWRTQDFSKVMYRRQLDETKAARLLRLALVAGMGLQIALGIVLVLLWHWQDLTAGGLFGAALIISYPLVWAHLAVVPLILGREFAVRPRERRNIKRSKKIFAEHQAVKIAVAGSYGKTTMKELLSTILSEGKKVAATPANKNVASSHAVFAKKLTGDEDILIIEYGEGKPGDVARFTRTTQPTYGIITGLAPAHLDRYKTLQAAGRDIFSLADYLHDDHVFINGESEAAKPFIKKLPAAETYSAKGCLGWQIQNVALYPDGTKFELRRGDRKLKLATGLLGRHQLGPLCLAVAMALELGLTEKQVKAGVAKTVPFEHRMQPYNLDGAWIIDDTYNGNLEGVRAGTALLGELAATHKWYVTPGLVDQGKETKKVHLEMGKLIAGAKPDVVVLMQNSVTGYIQAGLEEGGFQSEVRLENDPLKFYTNLDQFVAKGDVVMMQNDWTDNYY